MNVFDFINSINFDKKDLFEDPIAEKEYVPFIVNKGLSYFPDTVLYANQVNIHSTIPKQWQFDFLRHSIPKRKRFSKWHKATPPSEDIEVIQQYYQYSYRKAAAVADILTKDQIQQLRETLSIGGK